MFLELMRRKNISDSSCGQAKKKHSIKFLEVAQMKFVRLLRTKPLDFPRFLRRCKTQLPVSHFVGPKTKSQGLFYF